MSSGVADGFYPKKNVNINVDGSCYEFLGSAFTEYKYLDIQKRTSILKAQYNAIGPPNAFIPEITEFTDKYDIKVVEEQQVGDMNNKNSYIDKYIVKAMTAKPYFEQILNALTLQDFNPSTKTIQGSIGIQPNPFLTWEEGNNEISIDTNNVMKRGIHDRR